MKTVLTAVTLSLVLAACGAPSRVPTPSVPAATGGTIAGVRMADSSTYQLGFTPLDGTQIASTATLKDVRVTDLSAGTATATICGQVQVQDAITTAIALDSTGSMATNDPGLLRQDAARAFVARMGSLDRAAVLSFDTYTIPTEGLRAAYLWQDFTGDRALLDKAITTATFAGGGTPLYDAVIDASGVAAGQAGTGGTVLLLTDGEDTSSIADEQATIDAAKRAGTKVYAIGLDAAGGLDFQGLERITAATGGLFQKTTSAADLQGLFDRMYNAFRAQGCVQIAFTQKPTAGTAVTGTLVITVSAPGRAPADVRVPFTLTVG